MLVKKRYSLLTVFGVVLLINLSLFILGYLIIKYLKTPGMEETSAKLLSINTLLREVCAFVFYTL
ncbi:MAG: hypothetical protein ACQUYJ_13900, partial [Ferruginibacter sp.]